MNPLLRGHPLHLLLTSGKWSSQRTREQCNIWVEELKPAFERFANLTKEVTEINYLPCSEEHKDELLYYALAQLSYGRRRGQKRLFNFHSFCKGFLGRQELKTKLRETFDNNASVKRIFVNVCKSSLVNHMEDVSQSIISSGVTAAYSESSTKFVTLWAARCVRLSVKALSGATRQTENISAWLKTNLVCFWWRMEVGWT